MPYCIISLRSALTAALAFSAAPALAQTGGDFGGSFEPGAPPAQVAPPAGAQPPAAGGDFGGSFEGASPPAAGPPPAAGGDDFGGSFDTGGGAAPAPPGGGAVQPTPPPVAGGDFGGADFGGAEQPEPQPPANSGVDAQIEAFELQDFGVPPTSRLRDGQFHAPTPSSLPGARIVTTGVLAQALTSGQQIVVIDVLGGDYSLPGAFMAPALASGGSFNDRIQQQAGQWLAQITGNNPGQLIVVYCSDPHCWLSYNATLRVVAAGYANAYWYRGGIQAWQMAGLPLYPSGF